MEITISSSVLLFLLGVLLGCIAMWFYKDIMNNKVKIHGIIMVDDKTKLSKFIVNSTDIAEKGTKQAIFKVEHGVDLSREEQTL